MSLIEVKEVSYAYNDAVKAIDNVSFNIEEGTYTAIIGHNGSGKSTLAKMMAGLLQNQSGEIKIDNIIVSEENMPKLRNILGIVFQNPDNQFIGSTVSDDIAFGLENKMVETGDMQGIIEEYATKVGLSDYLTFEPQNLSGGQKQRVAIAGVLAMKPNIIIFDEATSMLDPKGKKEIKKLMADLAGTKKFTIISITHDIEEVMQADDCIVLNKGKVFMHDTPAHVFKDAKKLRSIDLDVPFVMQIKEALEHQKIKVRANDMEGMVKELCQYVSNR